MQNNIRIINKTQFFCSCLWLFCGLFLFFAIFASQGLIPSDTEYSIATAQAIVHTQSLAIPQTERLWGGVYTKSMEFISRYGIGYAVSFIPQVLLADVVHQIIPTLAYSLILDGVISFTNTFFAACIGLSLFILFIRLEYRIIPALTTIILISCGSILLPYSKIIHSEIPATLCLVLLLISITYASQLTLKKGLFLGFISSSLYLLKIGNLPLSIIVATYAVYLVIKKRYTVTGLVLFLSFALAPLIYILYTNYAHYGDFLNFGYGKEQKEFSTPLITGLLGLLFSPSKSLFIYSPLLIAGFMACPSFLKKHGIMATYIFVIFITDILFYATWHDWHGGWSFGPRLIVPAMIIAHVFLIEFVSTLYSSKTRKTIVSFLFIASFFIMLPGCLVCYQQVYYFHKDHWSIRNAHPVIAIQILVHKLSGKPEIYNCQSFDCDCSNGVYQSVWGNLTKDNSINFSSFEKYQGIATWWSGLYESFGMQWALFMPFPMLFASGLFFMRARQKMFLVYKR